MVALTPEDIEYVIVEANKDGKGHDTGFDTWVRETLTKASDDIRWVQREVGISEEKLERNYRELKAEEVIKQQIRNHFYDGKDEDPVQFAIQRRRIAQLTARGL